MTTHPSLAALRTVLEALERGGFAPTLGGSGLLYAHHLVDVVHDWDVLVDADASDVAAALHAAGLAWSDAGNNVARYAIDGRFLLTIEGTEVDVLARFAIRVDGETVVNIPSLAAGSWNDIPLGSMEAWLVAYRLMGRAGQPELIMGYLQEHGANEMCVQRLLTEPLPDTLRTELQAHLTPPAPRPPVT